MYSYAYDGEGRLKSVGGGTITYAYDGDGRMIKRTVSSTPTYYLYGQSGLLSEFTTATGVTAAASTDRLEYRVAEQTGTPVILMNSSGTVVENNRVFPYGEIWQSFTGSTNDQKFTTYLRGNPQQLDSELDYAMARYYAYRSGRFMSPDSWMPGVDPTNPQSWNLYNYVVNDPVNYVDPNGQECVNSVDENGQFCISVNVNTDDPYRNLRELQQGAARYYADPFIRDRDDRRIEQAHQEILIGEVPFTPGNLANLYRSKLFTSTRILDKLAQAAEKSYPLKIGKQEWHHVVPMYLGGAKDGLMVRISSAYHQLITNEFRSLWSYGQGLPSAPRLQQLLMDVYSKFPLPK